MNIPFTAQQFLDVFRTYNLALHPIQYLWILIAIIAIVYLHLKNPLKNRFINLFLGLIWIWTGLIYHIKFFSQINKAAYIFGAVFILQGVFFLIERFFRNKLEFELTKSWKTYVGYFFIVFGLLIYPLIGLILGYDFDNIIILGLPCPTTIFTFGLLMLTTKRFPKYLLIIPTLWAFVGTSAAFNFGIYQDIMLIISAIVADVWLILRKK